MITLLSPTEKEIYTTYNWLQDTELLQLFMMEPPSLQQHLNFFKKLKEDTSQIYFSIFHDSQHIGNCGLKYLNTDEPELWIYIGEKSERRKGYAFSACKELLTYFQSHFQFSFIKLHVLKSNNPAIKLYQKLGFEISAPSNFDLSVWKERINFTYTMKLKLNRVAMMQPTFLPWQGYFELIHHADTFIFLDDFQYSVGSFHNRNRLFLNKEQPGYCTIPINKKVFFKKAINEISVQTETDWKKHFIKTVNYNYQKAPFFNEIWNIMLPAVLHNYTNLAELNISLIKTICSILSINTHFIYSSDIAKNGQRSQLVYNILKSVNASCYLSANGSFEYMLEDKVFPCELPVCFQNFLPKPYTQIHSKDFIPYLSVLDALFNIGPQATYNLIVNGTEKWLSWEQRHNQHKENNNE